MSPRALETPVGEAILGLLVSANSRNLDVMGQDPRLGKLPSADLPKIEIGRTDLKGPEMLGKLFLKVDEFGSIGTETWRDADQNVGRIRAIKSAHFIDCLLVDVLHASAPAAVDSGKSMVDRIVEEGGLAVGMLDEER